MDAARRKDAWTNIEDEMWELGLRYKWLLTKVQDGRTGNLAELGQLRLESFNAVEGDQGEIQIEILERSIKAEESHQSPTGDIFKGLIDFLESLIDAISQTNHQMSVIKKLMWVSWEEDAISESFYDFLQSTHQLLDCLSFTWRIVMSMFRSTELDILCLSEKIASQIFSSYQFAVKSMTSCWQSYLAVHNRQKLIDTSNDQVKVRSSCYTVAAGYSKALSVANLFTLCISKVLLRGSGCWLELGLSEVGENCGGELKGATVVSKKDFKVTKVSKGGDDRRKENENKAEKIIKEAQRFCQETTLKRKEILSQEKLQKEMNTEFIKFETSGIESISKKDEDKRHYEVKRVSRYEYFNCKDLNGKSTEKNETKSTLIGKLFGWKCREKCSSQKVPILDLTLPVSSDGTRNHSHAYHVLAQPQEESSEEQSNSGVNVCTNKCCLQNSSSAIGSDLENNSAASTSCPNKGTVGTSQLVCSCCRCNPKMDKECTESWIKCSPSSNASELLPRFSSDDWKMLLGDLKDLKVDLEHLLNTITQSRIEESIIEKLKIFMDDDVTAAVEVLHSPLTLHKLFVDVVSSQLRTLEALETEMTIQMQIWENRESDGLIRANVKGLDPEEAFLRAKNLVNLQMQALFSLMLLIEAPHLRTFSHYSTLLCDSFHEAVSLSSNLVLARVVSSNKAIELLEGKLNEEVTADLVMLNDLIVHPYALSHLHSMTLTLAHAFCDSLFSILSQLAA